MEYQFLRDVTVNGVAFKGGDTITEADIPVGSFESLLATWLAPLPAAVIETTENEAAELTAVVDSETTQTESQIPIRKGKK